jgi:hypothetical protein
MTTTITADDGAVSGSAGLKSTADSSGTLGFVALSGLIDASTSTGGLIVPTGTTAQRPSSPVVGTIRYNTTNSHLEIYIASSWTTII